MNNISFSGLHSGNTAGIAWTVIADDKSAWVLFHYPSTHASASASSPITLSSSWHSQIFFGALKSPDLSRSQFGNFYVLNGARSAVTTSSGNGLPHSWNYIFGLRTPLNTIPTIVNASSLNWCFWTQTGSSNYIANPRSSVRVLIPVVITYAGNDVDKPSVMSTAYAHYAFATVPGVAEFSDGATGVASTYWVYCNQDRGASWNMDPYVVNGANWLPWVLSNTATNIGITDDAAWWA